MSRYEYLRATGPASTRTPYFFALDLRNCVGLLPRLLGSVVEAMRFLGPEHCALSIVEGNSADGTGDVLAALRPRLAALGVRTHLVLGSEIDPLAEGTQRFAALAELRNLALAPLRAEPERYLGSGDRDDESTVIFINDVAICPDDILELVHQRRRQRADVACAMDWIGDDPPVFYDSYVARAINGDTFFEIPAGGSWARATDLFWNEPVARARFAAHRPFQVFACWNGAVAFTAQPVAEGAVVFRGSRAERGECHHGEPQLFCKDMWAIGRGRVMVVPSINLEYSDAAGRAIKTAKGFTSQWVTAEQSGEGDGDDDPIDWQPPPEMVKCMPTFQDQTWRPWNETLDL
jgi:alpha-1,3-mannosyltransferase